MPSLVTERIESLKAGILSAVVFGAIDGVLILANNAFIVQLGKELELWQINSLTDFGLRLAIAFMSGFLFGLTYRYIIRGDLNSHLQDGAVLAFGLVRGFALVEGTNISPLWFLLIVESIFSFAIARFGLDLALKLKLIKPFV